MERSAWRRSRPLKCCACMQACVSRIRYTCTRVSCVLCVVAYQAAQERGGGPADGQAAAHPAAGEGWKEGRSGLLGRTADTRGLDWGAGAEEPHGGLWPGRCTRWSPTRDQSEINQRFIRDSPEINQRLIRDSSEMNHSFSLQDMEPNQAQLYDRTIATMREEVRGGGGGLGRAHQPHVCVHVAGAWPTPAERQRCFTCTATHLHSHSPAQPLTCTATRRVRRRSARRRRRRRPVAGAGGEAVGGAAAGAARPRCRSLAWTTRAGALEHALPGGCAGSGARGPLAPRPPARPPAAPSHCWASARLSERQWAWGVTGPLYESH